MISHIKAKYLFTKDKARIIQAPVEEQITAAEIYMKILMKFKPKNAVDFIMDWLKHRGVVYISDPQYYLVDKNILPQVKETKSFKYSLDVFDCDDISFLKKGYEEEYAYACSKNYAFGIIWVYSPTKGYGHALNFFFDENKDVYFYEPQQDKYFAETIDEWRLMVAFI
jgi:hypothetical protein